MKPRFDMIIVYLEGAWRVLHRRANGRIDYMAVYDGFKYEHDSYAHAVQTVRKFVGWRSRTNHLMRTNFGED